MRIGGKKRGQKGIKRNKKGRIPFRFGKEKAGSRMRRAMGVQEKQKKLKNVGLSNILNSELNRRKPVEGPHGQVVGTAVVKGKLL